MHDGDHSSGAGLMESFVDMVVPESEGDVVRAIHRVSALVARTLEQMGMDDVVVAQLCAPAAAYLRKRMLEGELPDDCLFHGTPSVRMRVDPEDGGGQVFFRVSVIRVESALFCVLTAGDEPLPVPGFFEVDRN